MMNICICLCMYMFGHVPLPEMVNKDRFVVAEKVSMFKVLYETVHID